MSRPALLWAAVLPILASCKAEEPAPPPPVEPDVYEIPEGWPVDGDPWASFTVRAGCTQTGDNGDTYTYDELGWPLAGAAGDATWTFSWTYTRVGGLVTDSVENETYGETPFQTVRTHDEHQSVLETRNDGELQSECLHTYYDVGLSRTARCRAPDADDPDETEYDLCGQPREIDYDRGNDVAFEVEYRSGCVLASNVERSESAGQAITITRLYDELGREISYSFDRAGDVTTVAYTWACD